ncbi:MAG: outer membrane beta-barrel protein, partial [Gammaproteobacteria bacterium]|nr:outer membrane beta-barrel protein [Gammaproteobacteria bacterium]
WYVGADTSQQEVIPYPSSLSNNYFSTDDILSYKQNRNDPDNNVSLFGGYRTNQNFSLQLEYQDDLSFGIDDMFAGSSLWFPEASPQNFESSGLFLSGISSYPINDNGALYMKGGLFNWEVDSNYYETSSNFLGQTRGTDIFYGLGANYDLNARFGVSAEWERYQMEKSDIDYLSTKLKFKF